MRALLAGLRKEEAYPHPVSSLHVVQTHASCVFLTGSYAYKVRKPVSFGFLDYSTVERRRFYSEQELLLNRRLCPEVYLDVLPVVESDGLFRIGGSGTVTDWVVRMRQLPEADMLPARLAAGTVGAAEVERIAEVLAAFHSQAATDPEIARFGSPEAVAGNVEENFTQTGPLVGKALPPEHLVAVRDWSHRFLSTHEELLERRVRGGRVRDGHGDLRAQNICLAPDIQGGVQIFDCIEFNDRFRYGDVAADLAYLTMDLDLAGRADLREVLVRCYQQTSGDADLAAVLRFYQCYRAYVRGKIALLAAAEAEIPADERRGHEDLAAAAFDLSRSYAERRERPALLITVGFSGSGKSVLARELARRLPAVRVASDDLRKELAGVLSRTRLEAGAYTTGQRAAIYEALRRRAREVLMRGEHVLLDATFLSAREREAAARTAGECGAEFWIVECRCPPEVIRQRILERSRHGGDASDADLTVYDAQAREYEPVDQVRGVELVFAGHVAVNTDQPGGRAARKVLEAFWPQQDARPPAPPG